MRDIFVVTLCLAYTFAAIMAGVIMAATMYVPAPAKALVITVLTYPGLFV